MACVYELAGICFVAQTGAGNIFPFKDFIAALALLVIVYTTTDVRYRFRIAAAPVDLILIAYVLIVFIGTGTLLTDIWIAEKWPVPVTAFLSATVWQGVLAALFMGLVLTWMFYAFMRPAVFGPRNFVKYSNALYAYILKGADAELAVIAHELAYSAEALVTYAARFTPNPNAPRKPTPEGYAKDMLLLIANKKLCRHLIASSPITAIRFLESAAKAKVRLGSIGLFVKNVSAEAIRNTDSNLYHEGDWFSSGLLGHLKPFSRTLYGNYRFVESLDNNSPLDIDYDSRDEWTAQQFEVYCNAVTMTVNDFLEGGHWRETSYVLNRAINTVQQTASFAVSEIKKTPDVGLSDGWYKLRAGVGCLSDMVKAIGKLNPMPDARTLRIRKREHHKLDKEDMYDRIAEAMFEITFHAAHIDGPSDQAWSIHHNTVWTEFFNHYDDSEAWRIIQHKLRRLLFDEIMRMDEFPNYKSAKVLGICLNVLGVKQRKRPKKGTDIGREYAALKAVLLPWVQKNYMKLREENPNVAEACLIGSITYDEKASALVKTYRSLGKEPNSDVLLLDPAPAPVPAAAAAAAQAPVAAAPLA